MLTEAKILTALRDCYDPELPCNIVDLGLVRAIAITPDRDAPGSGIPGVPEKHHVQIDIILTHPGEDAEAQLRAQIANRLAGLETVSQTTVTIQTEPLWSPVHITSAGRRILGLDGNPSLIQIR
ncbi:MAG TPA: metal-sulfur cluster assembly factor [Edaphobacter sp.]|uniref:metal-sulfur cluster assembly factor n=1 Tax=Edaphobacter sp. TaxID=1934404 RepID=UPI002C289B9F|nr:metal-sulfur cluster assembly factor [Edaphobacter sp.]HUZ97122.1 metal-sulfur cluster assembly factor [Edaphobacter sp.]